MPLTTGEVAFSNVTEHEVFNGRTTGKYSIVLRLDQEEAAKLDAAGVRLKDYEGVSQRKFASKFPIKVVDMDDKPLNDEMGHGSKVRVWWEGKPNEEFGTIPYLNGVRVIELAEPVEQQPEEF